MKLKTLSEREVQLLDAARNGDLDVVGNLLEQGIPVDIRDGRSFPFDVTPLMHGALNGHLEIVRMLLCSGANVHAADKNVRGEGGGRTALHYAAKGKHLEVAKLLIEAGAKVNAMGKGYEGTPLHDALERKPQYLSEIDPERLRSRNKSLSADEAENMLRMVEYLLMAGADPNLPMNRNGIRAIHKAAALGETGILHLLIAEGADINAQDSEGSTAFASAVTAHKIRAAILLIENGLNLSLEEEDRTTVLMWAVLSGNSELVNAVLRHKVDLHKRTKGGETALSLAIRDKHLEIVEILKRAGASE